MIDVELIDRHMLSANWLRIDEEQTLSNAFVLTTG